MKKPRPADSANVLVDQISDWLMAEALREPDIVSLVDGTAARVDAAGIPLQRFHISFNMLHPLYRGLAITWRRGAATAFEQLERTVTNENPDWLRSPLKHMLERRLPLLRRRLSGDAAMLDFPLLEDLRDQGATDYFAFLIAFNDAQDDGLIGSWSTDRPRGFLDGDLRALERIQTRLAVACRMIIRGQVAQNVVQTYLGKGAGRRVLSGQIRRGDGETIPAVIWYSDLRGSTAMAERLDRDSYTDILNCYFGCVGGAVMEAGGEILDFIGDAVLAIFPVDGKSPREAAGRALAAAQDAQRRMDGTNAERAGKSLPQLAYGLGLHVGEVMFGNIGTPERLSFSVIGPSVNQVARLESLTKRVGRPVVASRDFVEACAGAWHSLGHHEVAGIAKPIEVFAPGDTARPKPRAGKKKA